MTKLVIKKFEADWCGPCKAMQRVLDKVLTDFPDVTLEKIDADADAEQVQKYKIQSIPTMVFEVEGLEQLRMSGQQPEFKLKSVLKDLLTQKPNV